MVDLQAIPRLAPRAMEAYEKYCAIKEEKSRVAARLAELDKAQKLQEAIVSTQFDPVHLTRRIPGGKLLQITIHVVPTARITRKGYIYNTYKEVEI